MFIGPANPGVAHSFRNAMLVEDPAAGRADFVFFRCKKLRDIALLKECLILYCLASINIPLLQSEVFSSPELNDLRSQISDLRSQISDLRFDVIPWM